MRVYLSESANPALVEYLRASGHEVELIEADPRYGPGTESHADLRLFRMSPEAPPIRSKPPDKPKYPENAAMCAVILGGFLIHRLDITCPDIIQCALVHGLRAVDVRQGYTRCSCLPLGGCAAITPDSGIYAALRRLPGIRVLRIRPGHVSLPGYEYGFLPGCAGQVGGEVLFNGDLTRHPDCGEIVRFIESLGLRCRWFPGELTDIGSIL